MAAETESKRRSGASSKKAGRKSAAKAAAKKDIGVECAYDELIDPRDLQPNPKNPNMHSKEQIDLLVRIIEHQGWRAPITVSKRSGLVVIGHGRLEAALRMGAKVVPVDYQDFSSDEDELAHLLADNKLADLAEVDFQQVSALLKSMDGMQFDLTMTGFRDFEIEPLLQASWAPPRPDESSGSRGDSQTKHIVVTPEQRKVIDQAIAKLKGKTDDGDISDGRAVELICLDFLKRK